MRNNRLLFMVEIAVFSALALIFDLLANVVSFSLWPQGGSVSISMVPVFLMAYRWGVKGGLTTGMLLGLLQIISGTAYIMHPIQGLLDYIVAYTVVGFAGIAFRYAKDNKAKRNMKTSGVVLLGILLGSTLRFFAHFVAGMVFFGSGAAQGQSVVLFSLFYNLSYMLPSVIVSGMVMLLLFAAAPGVILRKSAHHH